MRNLFLPCGALLALLSLAGCQRDRDASGPTSVSGRVLDQATHQPVPGATVYLLQYSPGRGISSSLPQPVDPVTADVQGHYQIDFTAEKGYSYELQGKARGYLNGSLEMQPTVKVAAGRKSQLDVPLAPEGYVRVRVTAPKPQPYALAVLEDYHASAYYVGTDRLGTPLDSTVIIPMWGGQEVNLGWRVYPEGTVKSYGYSVALYCPARDTVDFSIRF